MLKRMKVALAAAAVLCVTSGTALAAPSGPELTELKGGGPVSLGLVGGTTNGVTLKVWPVKTHGAVLHLGASPILNSVALHLSYRLHFPPIVAPRPGPALFFQLGPAFRTRIVFQAGGPYAELGGGLVIGASVTVPDWPVEFFAEVQPTFAGSVSTPGTGLGFGVDGVAGVRISFGKKAAAQSTWDAEPVVVPAPEPEPAPETEAEAEGATTSPDAD